MCKIKSCCGLLDLHIGTRAIALFGIVLTFVHMLILVLGGKEAFPVLSFYEANYVYVGVVILVINFFVHCLLWSGVQHENHKELLPWMLFMLVKMTVMGSMALNVATTFNRDPVAVKRMEFCSSFCDKPITEFASDLELTNEFRFCIQCLNATTGEMPGPRGVNFPQKFETACLYLKKKPLISRDAFGSCSLVNEEIKEPKEFRREEKSFEGKNTAPKVMSILYVLLFIGVHFYFWIVVFSLFNELDANRMSPEAV